MIPAALVFFALGAASRPGDAALLYMVAVFLFFVGMTERKRG